MPSLIKTQMTYRLIDSLEFNRILALSPGVVAVSSLQGSVVSPAIAGHDTKTVFMSALTGEALDDFIDQVILAGLESLIIGERITQNVPEAEYPFPKDVAK